jgi:hypothetical protein
MLRMKDWRCPVCGEIEEILGRIGDPRPLHCGIEMDEVWLKAPGIGYRPQYSHALGKRIDSSAQLDRELAKKGEWVASKSEANSNYNTDIFQSEMTVQRKKDPEIRKHVEKAARMLKERNIIKSTGHGFEMVNK